MPSNSSVSASSVSIQAEITPAQLEMLKELAGRRGVSANTVLQQAIETAKVLADNVHQADEVLIRRPDNTYLKVLFDQVA